MKKMNLAMIVLAMGLSTWAQAIETVPATPQEVEAVMKSLNFPENPTAVMLKGAVAALKGKNGFDIVPESIVMNRYDRNFLGQFDIKSPDADQWSRVSFEVVPNNGKAYVINFNVERLSEMRKFPGVGMGNR